jgi:hypothetical protein
MTTLLEELEFYPYSKTVDILDCLGYAFRLLKPSDPVPAPVTTNPFQVSEIEKELKKRANSSVGYPFDFQLNHLGVRYNGN